MRHDGDGSTTPDQPVAVVRGGEGTTSLAENVSPLPATHYRVRKHSVSDPADVDGDCIDDLTELSDPLGSNPLNPAGPIDSRDGAVRIPDRPAFDALTRSTTVRFVLFGMESSTPTIYFTNTRNHRFHFDFLRATGLLDTPVHVGRIVFRADLVAACEAGPWTRCLQDSRYSVRVEWWTAGSDATPADVVPIGTNDSGLFRFFSKNNWEVLIKLLDGCAVNGSVWVFGASTTDLGYRIRVTDTVTETVREYRNEPGLSAPAITDVGAFPEGCRP